MTSEKEELRKKMLEMRRNLSAAEKEAKSQKICQNLEQLDLGKYKVVAAFSPFRSEPNIRPFLDQLQTETQVVFPRWEEASGNMEFDFEEKIACILVPGIAFDRQGNRLGFGKGYYDRFFAHLSPDVKKIGICFAFQVVEEVPHQPHDQKVDEIVTDAAIFDSLDNNMFRDHQSSF